MKRPEDDLRGPELALPALEATETAESAAPAAPPWRGLAPHRLRRVLTCIETRLAEPVQVSELAAEAHMSLFHFARMFKLATGHSPHQYITLQRMERAKELLAAREMSIVQVARAVGYQTQAHFTGVFGRNVGMTPKVYRMSRHRAQHPAAAQQPVSSLPA